MSQVSNSLGVFARLTVSVAGHEFSVQADDGVGINIELPNLRAGWVLFKQCPTRRQRVKFLEHLQAGLLASGLQLEFRLAGRIVAVLGAAHRPSLVAAILGLGPLQLRPGQLPKAGKHKSLR